MLQAGFGGNVLLGLRQFAPAQRRQQGAGEDNALLGQALSSQEVARYLERRGLFHRATCNRVV